MDVSEFLTSEGTGIKWGKLLTATFGGALLAVFGGLAEIITRALNVPISFVGELGEFIGRVITLLVEVPALAISGGIDEAVALVQSAGIGAFAVAVGIALAMTFIASEVVSRVRE